MKTSPPINRNFNGQKTVIYRKGYTMIWVILKDDGSFIITSNEENAILYTNASIVNGEHFKVIPFNTEKNDTCYYDF